MNSLRKTIAERKFIALGSAGTLLVAGGFALVFNGLGSSGVPISSPAELQSYFHDQGYTAEALHGPDLSVPPVYFSSVPGDWAEGLDVSAKKSLFFRSLLPLVLQTNQEIASDRRRLMDLNAKIEKQEALNSRDRKWLRGLAIRYAVVKEEEAGDVTQADLARLLVRVDGIPPSLALVQGAIESAYATSRFAVEGNALFGQWRLGKGLKPENQRTELGDYRVADFDTPMDSVRSYMRNLNTNPAYRPFRELRAAARRSGRQLDGAELAAGLQAYSERGEVYIDEIRDIIASNRLGQTDAARLRDGPPIELRAGLF